MKQIDQDVCEAICRALLIENETRGDSFYDLLGKLREYDPIFFFEEADMWIATGYSSVRQVLGSPAAEKGFAAKNDHTQPGWRNHRSRTNMAEWMGQYDGARHRRMRGAVNSYFMPAMAEAAETHLRPLIAEVVSDFRRRGGGEFIDDVGYSVTAKVTDYLLGLEDTAHPDFRLPIERIMKTFDFDLSESQWREADEAFDLLRGFWEREIHDRSRNIEGEDVIAQLLRSGKLSEHELVLVAENVLAAGSDTTANTSANGLHLLLRYPEQLALARRDRAARAQLPDEIMRLASAAPSSARLVIDDVDVGSRRITGNSVVLTLMAAANRDPAHFPNPHQMDLTRRPSSMALGFGFGPHICLGQWFVKKVMGILFDELLEQCELLEFDGPPTDPAGIGMRQMSHLMIRAG